MARFLVFAAAVCLLAACGAVIPTVSPQLVSCAQAYWPEATGDELVSGRAVLTTRCNTCHSLPEPGAHVRSDWEGYVREMGPKAQLSAEQQRDLLRYLVAAHDVVAAGGR